MSVEKFGPAYYMASLPCYRALVNTTSEPAKKPEPKALPANGAAKELPEPAAEQVYAAEA